MLNKLHLNVENRQYEVNTILSDFILIERESKNDELATQVHDFKERWLRLRSQLRLSVSHLPFENSVSNRNGDSLGEGPGSTASVSSCETTHETQASRTTYYNSQVLITSFFEFSACQRNQHPSQIISCLPFLLQFKLTIRQVFRGQMCLM